MRSIYGVTLVHSNLSLSPWAKNSSYTKASAKEKGEEMMRVKRDRGKSTVKRIPQALAMGKGLVTLEMSAHLSNM